VVKDAGKIKVLLNDEREYDAIVVGRDSNTDLALIKINTNAELPFVLLGNSDNMKVGQWVVAIGSPFGLDHTVTAGIISAKGRAIGSGLYDDFIQTDASINPGNSGGPLINMNGEVIGINSAIASKGWGIGFSIPINMAKDIIHQLRTDGEVVRGWIGVGIQDLDTDLAEYYGIAGSKGVLIIDVFPGDPADKAGLKNNDIILSIDDKSLKNSRDLTQIIASLKVGHKAAIEVLRNGKNRKFHVNIAKRQEEKIALNQTPPTEKGKLGIHVTNLTKDLVSRLNLGSRSGVMVVNIDPNSKADSAGLQIGDIIYELNHTPIVDIESFSKEIDKIESDQSVDLLIHRFEDGLIVVRITR
jgi:serine protease Do